MLLKQNTLKLIKSGDVNLVFRKWKRANVKTGGTQMTSMGVLSILSVDIVEPEDISDKDATRAGYSDREELLALLDRRSAGEIHRIGVAFAGEDPRIALRETLPDETETASIVVKLRKMDQRSKTGPWIEDTLSSIEAKPATLAATLAAEMGMEKHPFKARVRKLKALGLTESLKIGYQLSPRGQQILEALRSGT